MSDFGSSAATDRTAINLHGHNLPATNKNNAIDKAFNHSFFKPYSELQQSINRLAQQHKNQVNLSTGVQFHQFIEVAGSKGEQEKVIKPVNHVEIFIQDPSLSPIDSWFGHAALRIDDKLYEALPLGKNKSALYVHDDVSFYVEEGATGIKLNLTPEQASIIKETMPSFKGKPYSTLSHNCTTSIVEALENAGINFALPTITPMALENYLSRKDDIVINSTEYPKTTNE